jgi:putative oxidoreductase
MKMQRLEKLLPLALLLLRLALGIVFFSHGYPKLRDPHDWTRFFVQMGFPSYFAYIAGALETLGSLLLAMGLWTRVAGLLLAGEMTIALLRVDLPGSLLKVSNYELSMLLAASSFVLVVTGAGMISVDHAIFRNKA